MIQLLDLPLPVFLALWVLRRLQPKVKAAAFLPLMQMAQDEARLADVIEITLMKGHEPNWIERGLYIIVKNHTQSIYNNLERVKSLERLCGEIQVGFIPFHE